MRVHSHKHRPCFFLGRHRYYGAMFGSVCGCCTRMAKKSARGRDLSVCVYLRVGGEEVRVQLVLIGQRIRRVGLACGHTNSGREKSGNRSACATSCIESVSRPVLSISAQYHIPPLRICWKETLAKNVPRQLVEQQEPETRRTLQCKRAIAVFSR